MGGGGKQLHLTRPSSTGMWFDPGNGYHQDKTTGLALGNQPESIYAVMSGTHYNGACCFVRSTARLSCAPHAAAFHALSTPL